MLYRNLLLALALLIGSLAVSAMAQPDSSAEVTTSETLPALTKFDLEFPGGTPAELVAAIQRATGRPLNVIVQPKDAATVLPALQMKSIDVAQLFRALSEASPQQLITGFHQYTVQYRFETQGKPHDASIWYFSRHAPPENGDKRAMFFLLTPYLAAGLTVDDITTAIQTAWAMQGGDERPEISYHKETNLLIAVGGSPGLETISFALEALKPRLESAKPSTGAAPASGDKS